VIVDDVGTLIARARGLAASGSRAILGIAGAPGGGKSTLADTVVAALGDAAVLVPMDGFHLAQPELVRLGRRDRMGAPDTFDACGYVALLARLRARDEEVVYAPEFRREIEEPIAGAIGIAPDVPLVVTEGNYLLVDDGDWAAVRPLLAEA
jgi:pantothenate kinase